MKKHKFFFSLLFFSLIISATLIQSCKWGIDIEGKYRLKTGEWRGALTSKGGEIPFLFDLKRTTDSTFSFFLYDGDQQIESNQVEIIGDTIMIKFPIYESILIAQIVGIGGDTLKGNLIRTANDSDSYLPFNAVLGGKYKFVSKNSGKLSDFSGKFQTVFTKPNGDTSIALGIFEQNTNEVSGTFLSPTGDYRYLTGIATEDSMLLSGFDGSSAYLVKAKIYGDSLSGLLYSGAAEPRKFKSVRNNNYTLPDANTLSGLKPGFSTLNFKLLAENGDTVSLQNEVFKNKVVIVQILGSWCPNCLDETAFLAPFYKQYAANGVEVLGLSFERTAMPEKAYDNINQLKKRFNATYTMVFAGKPSSEVTAAVLPELEKVAAFPTTIIIGKDGKVKQVHTGFSGPGTGNYYQEYVREFTNNINRLLEE